MYSGISLHGIYTRSTMLINLTNVWMICHKYTFYCGQTASRYHILDNNNRDKNICFDFTTQEKYIILYLVQGIWYHFTTIHWVVLYQKQVSKAGTSNHIPQYLWDAITYPFRWCVLLVEQYWFSANIFTREAPQLCAAVLWVESRTFALHFCGIYYPVSYWFVL